ncbi:Yip1 family protein [Ignavibacterium sp.]|uniref:Yip1 family protein n=1 Tax=Ignavibacterium sp. TaxID=2651167 RepID=UPI00307CF8BF
MNYKNEIVCKNCGTKNFDFEYICKNCKAFLRNRIVNIDLGETLLRLIDSPSETFLKIKFSEHKNYIFFLLFFISIRFLILSRFFSVPFVFEPIKLNLPLLVIISFLITLIFFVIISLSIQKILLLLKVKARFRDILAVMTYSFLPNLFALFILFPIEMVFYGEYLFSNNPYPFQIKESIFYFLLSLETLCVFWSVFLFYVGIKEFTYSRIFSLIFSIIVWIVITLTLYWQSKIFLI